VFNGGVIDLSGGNASGPLLGGDFSGQIWTTVPLGRSRLKLQGAIVPTQELVDTHPSLAEPLIAYLNRYMTDSIPFQIEGTVAEPLLNFENYD
jgi:hypothetical protein